MTQKIIQTTEHQLSVARAIIKQKEEEIRKLRLALSRAQLAAKNEKQPAVNKHTPLLRDRPTSGSDDDRPHTGKGVPSYARSTRASLLRESTASPTSSENSTLATSVFPSSTSSDVSKHAPQPVTFAGKAYTYKNGKLGRPNYLRSTKATVNKFGHYEEQREKKCGVSRPLPARRFRWTPTPDPYAVPTAGRDEVIQPQQPVQMPQRSLETISQEDLEDRNERERLETQTRLFDDDWVSELSNNVWLDHNKMYEILFTAERLGKECWREWLRINEPKKCTRYLSDVDFARNPMTRFLERETSGYRATEPHEIIWALRDMVYLRNFVHHFSGWSCYLERVEGYLADVQTLAVRLYDEERAHAARALRDRLRRETEEVARELDTARFLTALPFTGDYQWKPYHGTLFELVNESLERGHHDEYSPAAIAVAIEFARRGSDVSRDCEQAVEGSLAKVLRAASGGCGGVQ